MEISDEIKTNGEEKLTKRKHFHFEQNDALYRSLFEEAIDGMVLWNRQYEIVDINPVASKILNVDRDDIIGKNIRDLFEGRIKEEVESHLEVLGKLGTTDSMISIPSSNGNKHFEISSKGNVTSNLSLTVIRNVTEKIALQEQLQKSDTLSVVGELAAGIAHEIRNPMTALKGFIQLLEMNIKEDHSMYFKVIMSELRRIESTITEFLILAKPQAILFKTLDMRTVMNETLELLNGQALMNNIQFKIEYDEQLPECFCEPNQMKQVFINIIKNAMEVMPSGGIVTIKINNIPSEFIHIVIEDEGEGISKKKIKRLGEPFYTTKERGTGLGLMVSYKIIKEHKGKIEVESKVGVGTKFHLYIPIKKK